MGESAVKPVILLVSDESEYVDALTRRLEQSSYSVKKASQGAIALEILREESADLVLLDIELPGGIDGIATAKAILRLRTLPLLFLIPLSETPAIGQSAAIANYGYVVKDSPFSVLDASIQRAFDLFAARCELDEKSTALEVANEELQVTVEQLKETEALTNRKQLFLRSVIDAVPDPVYFLDSDARKIMANNADLVFMGLKDEAEAVGKTDLELYPGEIGERGYKDNLEVLRQNHIISNREESFIGLDGRQKWLLTTKLPLHDEQGAVIGVIGIGRDITERKLSQDRMDKERILLKTLIEVLPDPIYVKDNEGRKIVSNAAHFNHLPLNDMNNEIGKSDLDLFPGERGRRGYQDDMLVLKEGLSILGKEEDFLTEDGSLIWLQTSKVPLRNARGEIFGLVGIGHDITERKLLEQNLQKSVEEKTVLMRELEHRVKNSLMMVSALLDLESAKISDPRALEVFANARRNVQTFSAAYERLYMSKDLTSIEVKPYLETLMEWFSESFLKTGKHEIRLESSLSDFDLPPGKALPLGLILNELLTNSYKHGTRDAEIGCIQVSLWLEDSLAHLRVSDNGPGFPPDFDVTKHAQTGLSLVSVLSEQLKGQLSVQNAGGANINLTFTLA